MTFTSKISKGSAAELRAAAWFAERGFHVFRSVSHACPIDLIVYKDRTCFRIEVKSARPASKGGWTHGGIKHPLETDGVVIVYPNGSVRLKPSPWQTLNAYATEFERRAHTITIGPTELTCTVCGVRFTARRFDAEYCSAACRQKAHRARVLSIPDTYRGDSEMKCKHGIYDESACAACKDWPTLESMQNKFPSLTTEMFLVMTPAQRVEAVKTGVLNR